MANLFRRIYDWLLRLFWCVLLLCCLRRAPPSQLHPAKQRPFAVDFFFVFFFHFSKLTLLSSAGRPRWTSP
jgi:hypothetical protein